MGQSNNSPWRLSLDNRHLTVSCHFQTLIIGDQRSSRRSGNYFFSCCFLLSTKTLDKSKEKQSIAPAHPWGQAVGVLTQLIWCYYAMTLCQYAMMCCDGTASSRGDATSWRKTSHRQLKRWFHEAFYTEQLMLNEGWL